MVERRSSLLGAVVKARKFRFKIQTTLNTLHFAFPALCMATAIHTSSLSFGSASNMDCKNVDEINWNQGLCFVESMMYTKLACLFFIPLFSD